MNWTGLLAILVLILLSALAYWRPTATLFIILFGIAWTLGLATPDILSTTEYTSSLDITVAIICMIYGLVCAGRAFNLMFGRPANG